MFVLKLSGIQKETTKEKKQKTDIKVKRRRLRTITLQGATEKSLMLLSQVN